MRGPVSIATAVRTPSGEITVKKDAVHSITERYPILKKPFLRGSVALCESLVYGMKSLSYSAQAAGEEDEQLSNTQMALTMAVSVVLAIVFFPGHPDVCSQVHSRRGRQCLSPEHRRRGPAPRYISIIYMGDFPDVGYPPRLLNTMVPNTRPFGRMNREKS